MTGTSQVFHMRLPTAIDHMFLRVVGGNWLVSRFSSDWQYPGEGRLEQKPSKNTPIFSPDRRYVVFTHRVRNRFYQLIGKTGYRQLIGGYFQARWKTDYFEINQNQLIGRVENGH